MKYETLRLRKEIKTFFEIRAVSQHVILTNVHFGSTQFSGARLGSIQFFDLSLGSTQLIDSSVGSIQIQIMAWVHSTTVEPKIAFSQSDQSVLNMTVEFQVVNDVTE